jgi:hypothetical protein
VPRDRRAQAKSFLAGMKYELQWGRAKMDVGLTSCSERDAQQMQHVGYRRGGQRQ